MNYEIAETLKLIIDQYAGRTQGSVFIKMTELPIEDIGARPHKEIGTHHLR